MTDPFYKSPIIGQEIKEMEQLYMDLARLSIDYPKMDDDGKREHIDATMTLIAKQKVFYARLCLLSSEDKEAAEIKHHIDEMSKIYGNGKSLNDLLSSMEDKLRDFKKELDKA